MSDNKVLFFNMIQSAFGADILRLLEDPLVLEIYLNPDSSLWEDRLGVGKRKTNIVLSSDKALSIIRMIASTIKKPCNEKNPILSAELPLPDNKKYRFQGFIAPTTPKPIFNIRKRSSLVISLDQYVEDGIVTLHQSQIIRKAIANKKNIVVAGSTGTGKTTFTNALLMELEKTNERIAILEQTNELQCKAEDYFILREDENYAPMDALLRGILRASPDRIIVGEVRGGEAYTMLKAWNTGHPGGIATLHTNSAEETFERVEAMVQEAKVEPSPRMLSQAMDIILYLSRTEDYAKKQDGTIIFNTTLSQIMQVKGYDRKEDKYLFDILE